MTQTSTSSIGAGDLPGPAQPRRGALRTAASNLKRRLRWGWRDGLERAVDPAAWEARREAEEIRRLEEMVGPVGYWHALRKYTIGFLTAHGLERDHDFLEIGCGPLSSGIAMIDYLDRGRYTGVDVRDAAITEAHKQLAKHSLAGKNPRLVVSSHFGADELGELDFDVVWAGAMVFHLTDELADALFAQVRRRLRPNGRFFCNVNTEAPEGPWQEFPFVKRPVSFYEEIGRRHGLRVESHGQLLQWSYPEDLPGRFNVMLETTHA